MGCDPGERHGNLDQGSSHSVDRRVWIAFLIEKKGMFPLVTTGKGENTGASVLRSIKFQGGKLELSQSTTAWNQGRVMRREER